MTLHPPPSHLFSAPRPRLSCARQTLLSDHRDLVRIHTTHHRSCLLQCFDSTGRHIAHYAVNRSTCSSVGQCHYGRCYLKGSPNLENQYNYVSFSILVSTVQMKFGRNEQPQDLQLAILYDRNNSDGLSYERGQIICRPNKMFRFSKSPEIDLKVQCDLMPINKDAYLEFQLLGDEGVTYVRTFKQKLKTMLGAGKIQFPLDELDEYMEVEIIGSDTPAYND